MAQEKCNHCGKYKDEEEFNWRYKALGIRHPTCRDCALNLTSHNRFTAPSTQKSKLKAVIFFAGSMYIRINAFGPSMMFGWNNENAYGPGGMMGNGGNMMNGYGYNNANLPALTIDQ